VHQFGSRNGKIPARPFLGLSRDDEIEVLDILDHYLSMSLGGP
jgi:phage gpG-like protein